MEMSSQEYLFKHIKKRSKWFSILDVNLHNEPDLLQYPIQIYRNMRKVFVSFPTRRYQNVVAFYLHFHVTKDDKERIIYPTGNTAFSFHCNWHKPEAFFIGTPTFPRETEWVSEGDYFVPLLWPGIGYAFCPVPQTELADTYVPLNDVITGEVERTTERITLAKNYEERVRLFEHLIEERITFLGGILDRLSSLVKILYRNPNDLRCEELSRHVFYSDRHIRRLFLQYIGLTPKRYARLVRHQKILRALSLNPYQDMACMAVEQGYCDQAHFIKEFKRFQGCTPTQFIRDSVQSIALSCLSGF